MKIQDEFKYISKHLVAFTLLLLGCSSDSDWTINEKEFITAPQEMAMPIELFKENIETTNYTAVVLIKKARILKKPVWPLYYFSDYLNHFYEADVLETFKGPEYKKITYSVMAEAELEPFLPNYPIVLSLCGSNESGYYVPDNGYKSAASDLLIDVGRSFKSGNKPFKTNINACK